jgi:hypothetical protein
MSRFCLGTPSLKRFSLLGTLAAWALSASACGQPAVEEDVEAAPGVAERARNVESCTVTNNSPPPTLSLDDSVITLQCGVDPWVAPDVTAVDACGNAIAVSRFNTGDDDGDSVPGSSDPDDFGPGPDASMEGTYYVSYLAVDSAYHVKEITLTVNVVNCQP